MLKNEEELFWESGRKREKNFYLLFQRRTNIPESKIKKEIYEETYRRKGGGRGL